MRVLFSGSKIVNPFRFLEVFETWGPYIDGELIKEQAVTAFLKGHWQKEKPVLLGKGHTYTVSYWKGQKMKFGQKFSLKHLRNEQALFAEHEETTVMGGLM